MPKTVILNGIVNIDDSNEEETIFELDIDADLEDQDWIYMIHIIVKERGQVFRLSEN